MHINNLPFNRWIYSKRDNFLFLIMFTDVLIWVMLKENKKGKTKKW
jgi:hypothetical protein